MAQSFENTLPTEAAGPDTVPTTQLPAPDSRLDSRSNPHTSRRRDSTPSQGHAESRPITSMLMAHEEQALRFTGSGSEYFRIWIVNLALTLLTLGVYSAWAKVRRLQYFYRNTSLDGACFDYVAKPTAILVGRLLALVLFLAYYLAFEHSALLGGLVTVLIALALPFLLWQSFRFKARNTLYRGIAFGYDGTLAQAYGVMLPPIAILFAPSVVAAAFLSTSGALWAAGLSFLSLLVLPYFHALFRRHVQQNLRYGDASFGFGATTGDFIRVWAKGIGVTVIIAFLLFAALVIAISAIAAMLSSDARSAHSGFIGGILGVISTYLAFVAVSSYYTARFQKLVWHSTALDDISFRTSISAMHLLRIQLLNTVLVILTLGLYRPFAAVRVAHYRLQTMTVVGIERLSEFHAGVAQSRRGATGESAGELFDLDLAL
jgi:uncharacterized membrane protein YjgN (DUF898 family)